MMRDTLLLGLLAISVLVDSCPYKECLCVGGYIFCNYRHLTSVPERLSESLPYSLNLDLTGNTITSVPTGSLPGNLLGLYLQSNPIETIDDTALDESIYTLQEISFSQARFTQIPEAVFHLKALTSLIISETNILVWNKEAMLQLGANLKSLDLDIVGLTTWPTWIKSMTNLTSLSISGNSISVIPDDALDFVAHTLTELGLDNNSLTTVPAALAGMTTLNKLTLEKNRIVDVTWLPQLSHIHDLSLNGNKISDAETLSSRLKPYADTLYNFDIHNNYLTSIPKLDFLTQIPPILDLTFNHISDPNGGSAPNGTKQIQLDNNLLPHIPSILFSLSLVTDLELSYNNIRTINGPEFSPSITTADLSSNLITQLSRSSFPENSVITYLNLDNNPLSLISPDAFNNLQLLTGLHLQNTKLTRLPLAILSLTKLSYLDVSSNTNLICTCMEQSLQPRIQTMDIYNMLGDCGMSSVYYFFNVLSHGCPPIASLERQIQ